MKPIFLDVPLNKMTISLSCRILNPLMRFLAVFLWGVLVDNLRPSLCPERNYKKLIYSPALNSATVVSSAFHGLVFSLPFFFSRSLAVSLLRYHIWFAKIPDYPRDGSKECYVLPCSGHLTFFHLWYAGLDLVRSFLSYPLISAFFILCYDLTSSSSCWSRKTWL